MYNLKLPVNWNLNLSGRWEALFLATFTTCCWRQSFSFVFNWCRSRHHINFHCKSKFIFHTISSKKLRTVKERFKNQTPKLRYWMQYKKKLNSGKNEKKNLIKILVKITLKIIEKCKWYVKIQLLHNLVKST